MPEPRIISLIASSTETICALGYKDHLVGRSHECDYPPSVLMLPACSEARFDLNGSSLEIDERVKTTLQNAISVYSVFEDELEWLRPTHIITQDQCEVCAVRLEEVEEAACKLIGSKQSIVSLAPNELEDIFNGIQDIAESLDDPESGQKLILEMKGRLTNVETSVASAEAIPSVVCVEWIDPFMAAGIWIPELVEMAKGNDLLGISKAHTPKIPLSKLIEADPDKIIVMLCGWDIEKSRSEMDQALTQSDWQSLQAVRSGELYITDGNHFFNRPGPRIVESAEILAEILHPELANFGHQGTGWQKY